MHTQFIGRPRTEIEIEMLCHDSLNNLNISVFNFSQETQKTAYHGTLQPLYNIVRYNTALDITRFKDGSQKCIDYIEK